MLVLGESFVKHNPGPDIRDYCPLVNRFINRLEDWEERFALFAYFGLNGPRMTYRDIGDMLGISQKRVAQIVTRALGKFRELQNNPQNNGPEISNNPLRLQMPPSLWAQPEQMARFFADDYPDLARFLPLFFSESVPDHNKNKILLRFALGSFSQTLGMGERYMLAVLSLIHLEPELSLYLLDSSNLRKKVDEVLGQLSPKISAKIRQLYSLSEGLAAKPEVNLTNESKAHLQIFRDALLDPTGAKRLRKRFNIQITRFGSEVASLLKQLEAVKARIQVSDPMDEPNIEVMQATLERIKQTLS